MKQPLVYDRLNVPKLEALMFAYSPAEFMEEVKSFCKEIDGDNYSAYFVLID